VITTLAYIPSPSQGVWHLGPLPIRAYALFIIAGIIVALIIGDRRWEARGGEPGVIYDIALWAVPFGLIGGRLYHVITDWQTYFGPGGAGLGGALRIWDGGLGIWGAVALGGVGAWIACRRRGIPLPAFGDAIAPGIVLAQAFGRIGNYFNQELYGRATTLPWGLEIYERQDANGQVDYLNGVSTGQLDEIVHPTFLYELLWNVLVFFLLIWVDRRFKIGHGRLFATYVAAYCIGRFWIELMRSDAATHIAGIRINSFTSTFVFIGAVVYIMVAPKGREDPSELRGRPQKAEELEESPVDEVAKELAAVASTTGVVAAAKVAGDDEDEDAKLAGDTFDEPVAEETEPVKAEAAEPADESATPVDGLGAVEGDEVVGAQEAAEQVHESAVEGADAAEAAAAETAEEAEPEVADPETEEHEAEKPDTAEPEAEEPELEQAEEPDESATPAGGLGALEGDEVVETEEAAEQAHESAVEGADAAEAAAAEIAEEAEPEVAEPDTAEPEAEEPELEQAEEPDESATPTAGLGAVERDEVVEAQEAAEQVHESAVEGADAAEAAAAEIAEESEDAAPPPEDAEVAEPVPAEPVEAAAQIAEESQVEKPPYPADAQVTEDPEGRGRRWWRRRG
jgi:prolipoprotein diacylglyceryl transferase